MKRIITYLAVIVMLFSQKVVAQKAGSLDSTFNGNGINVTPWGSGDAENFGVAIQPADGKIVTAGFAYNSSYDEEVAIARYKINGTLDSTFNSTGVFTKLVGSLSCEADAIAIQTDGKIVIAGFMEQADSTNDFLLLRVNADGTIDNTFGTNGIVTTDFNTNNDEALAIAIQPDGKIIAAGAANNGSNDNFALARYNANGVLDNSFGTGGKLTTVIGSSDNSVYALVIQPDSNIVAGGYSTKNYSDFTLARYNPNGTLDNTFGTNGIVVTDASGFYNNEVYSLALQTDGKIVAGGYANNDSDDDFAIARYNNNGNLDSTFGTNGITVTDFSSSNDYIYSVIMQPDNKIVGAGYTYFENETYLFALARYETSGILDSTFGAYGLVTTNINNSDDDIYAAVLQADGKIVATGTSKLNGVYNLAAARYLTGLNTGVLDFTSPLNSYLIYPNPVSENARLEYELINTENISIQLFDMNGRLINTFLTNQNQTPGKYSLNIPFSSQLSAGAYFVKISSGNGQVTVKMVKD